MTLSRKTVAIPLAAVAVLAAAIAVLTPTPAEAQCGSSTSSCQNCHEVQGQMPVNAQGDWHVSHAFGDFCQFCHAGNVQATDEEAAHQGMVEPLADPNASCGACHANDVQQLAQVYGTELGVEVGVVLNASAAATPAAASSPTATVAAAAMAAAPAGAEMVDYNELYAETVQGKPNTGNMILIGLIVLGVVAGGGYVVWNERRRRAGKAAADDSAIPSPPTSPDTEPTSPTAGLSDANLASAIAALDPAARKGLEQLLRDPEAASRMLRRLAGLDPEMIRTLRGLDPETRALLLALTSD
jgi:hypothetical protein